MKPIILMTKILLTFLIVYGWRTMNVYINAVATAASGSTASLQFSNDSADYAKSMVSADFFKNMSSGVPTLVAIILLCLIWAPEIGNLMKKISNQSLKSFLTLAFIAGLGAMSIPDANAYYSRTDWAEVVNVLPNHSAFLIPATGDTKDSQKQFESENFLNEKKVGAKRIQIPHVVLKNSGAIDYYVPGAIVVILDRTPYVVAWTKAANDNSPTNQEMCVESQDAIQVCFDTSIGANVTEEDAAKYLYWFGTEASGLTGDEAKFPSTLNGKSLKDVMNTRVFSRIHSAYFAEFSKYKFADMLAKKSEILTDVEKKMIAEYKKMGITIEYVGIASDLRFNPLLQTAITSLAVAEYDAKAAAQKLTAAQTDRYIAETGILVAKAEPYKKWDGKTFPNVPGVMVSSDSVVAWFKEMWNGFTAPAAPAK